ncbi:immunity protein YezG family protein [Peribacillus sp. FSL M8-0224]|nr:antitoxin YezG family protein [Brevibacterium sp. PAMC21349]
MKGTYLDELKELSDEFKDNNQEQWTNLFTLESTGEFKVDYDYDLIAF